MIEKMFELAARTKMRFPFKGQVTVEDLWDLSLQSLDLVFKTLNAQAKLSKEESLLSVKTQENKTLDSQIEIVKYIVAVKMEEDLARLQAREQREKKQKILSLINAKQEEELSSKSKEELEAMLAELT